MLSAAAQDKERKTELCAFQSGEAGFVQDAKDWAWSSWGFYFGKEEPLLRGEEDWLRIFLAARICGGGRLRGGSGFLGGLVFAGNSAKSDSDAVPGVDDRNGVGQVDDFLLGEMGADACEDIVGSVRL